MAEYNLSKPDQKKRSDDRYKALREKGAIIELREITGRRSLDQNGWLHMLITLYAIEFGHTMEEAKTILKRECHFMRYSKKTQEGGKEIQFLKQTSRLDTKECSEFIEWIYTFAGQNGCHLPTKDEYLERKGEYQAIMRSHRQYL